MMASSTMHPPLPPYSQPYGNASTESSPPPSPTPAENTPSDTAVRKKHSLQQLSFRTPTDPYLERSPRLLYRQETPPSPPNSVLIDEDARGNTSAPVDRITTNKSSAANTVEGTPRSSIRGKFTKVFKSGHKRGSSEASSANPLIYQKHRKDNSTSTNTTSNPLGQSGTTPSSHSSMQPASSRDKNSFYSEKSPLYHGTKRKVMRGGEVRVEIQRENIVEQEHVPENEPGDGSNKYYAYYTRSSLSQSEDEDDPTDIPQRSKYAPPLPDVGEHRRSQIERNISNSSAESQERKYAEEATATFEGFHFGLSEDENAASSAQNSPNQSKSPTTASPTQSEMSPPLGVLYSSSSGKASSSVLNVAGRGGSTTPSRSYSSSAYPLGARTPSSLAIRPAANRNISSSSHAASARSPSSNDDVTRELRRLSKISAGSGMSGLAIVVGVDGPASLDSPVDEDEGARPTREEKGKGRATPLGGDSMQDASVRKSDGRDPSSGYGRPGSGYTTGTERESHSDSGDDDSKGLLEGSNAIDGDKRLKSQVPAKGVLVHQPDTRFDFIYRMRQTADDTPILVPQYNFPATSSFPNRNALTAPIPAKLSPAGQDIAMSTLPSSGFQDSPVQRPPSAVLHSPQMTLPQGDYTYDTVKGSPMGPSYNSNDQSMVHPAFRAPSQDTGREIVSMGSLEVFGGGFRTISPSGRITETLGTTVGEDRPASGQAKKVHIDDEIRRFSDIPHQASEDNMRQQFSEQHLSSLPRRPGMQRRSITPHLWAPSDIGDSNADLYKSDMEMQTGDGEQIALRKRQAKVGRMLLAFCLLFPPLFFVMGFNGFDMFVSGWTGGAVKNLGRTEKRLALLVGTLIATAAVAGIIVGVSVGVASA